MKLFVPKSWELYYSCNLEGKIKEKMNKYDKEDLFNIINGLCFKTREEVNVNSVMKIMNDYIMNAESYARSKDE